MLTIDFKLIREFLDSEAVAWELEQRNLMVNVAELDKLEKEFTEH